MEPITIALVVGYLAKSLKDNKSVQDFFNDFTAESVKWIRPLFLKEDGTEEKVIQKLKENPESTAKQDAVKALIASEIEDNPEAGKYLEEMASLIKGKANKGEAISIINSKNVVTGDIKAGGNVIIGDNNNNTNPK